MLDKVSVVSTDGLMAASWDENLAASKENWMDKQMVAEMAALLAHPSVEQTVLY